MKRIMTHPLALCLLLAASFAAPSCNDDGSSLQESQLIYFSITEPYTRIGGIACNVDNIGMTVTNIDPIPADIDLSAVAPYFVLNHEGTVSVNGKAQQSGVTKQNLTAPVVYEVSSPRGTLKYTVNLTKSGNIHTQAGVVLSKLTDLTGEIVAERELWLDPGVRFSEVEFKAADDGRGLRLDLFEIDMTRSDLALYPLTAGHITEAPAEGTQWPVQTIPEQAAAAEAAGIKVLGAVNGDFYDINATNAPEGPICRNGFVMKDSFLSESSNRYFGIRDDGRASVGGFTDFLSLTGHLPFAVGGRQYLLQGDAPAEEIKADQPRSHRVGIGTNLQDHKMVYIACVEGIDGSTSSIRLLEMAYVLKAFGAAEALNLDGGGSATFVIKEDGAFKAVNRPGGTLRPVVNGVAVIKR